MQLKWAQNSFKPGTCNYHTIGENLKTDYIMFNNLKLTIGRKLSIGLVF